MPKLELIKCWKVNPEGNISQKDATLTRRLNRWPNKKKFNPFSNFCFKTLPDALKSQAHYLLWSFHPALGASQTNFSLGIVFLAVVSLALLLLTRLMCAFTPNSTQLTLTVCAPVFIVKQLHGTLWIKHKILLFTCLCPQHTSAFSYVCKIISTEN